ncbi:MAG: hypothetical protein EPN56_11210 [Rhodanobacter sp.]|nr:MAG: hypothetical protein EPN78_12610 [Rhodanobacter sp.]TAM13158.1 MAG: hypothetical protein EPN66_06400 [Rhodanobacter sp.]TAM35158.1 MAG: hypothetical protein EPN56_11210 [Rhodanobacter sp.]
MTSAENNNDDWREIRSRADSIANAVFLIGGGALSLSISVMLGNKASGLITLHVAGLAISAWYALLASIILFLLLKGHLIFQAYTLQFNGAFLNRHIAAFNRIGWSLGLLGFATFVIGLIFMVRAAALAVGAP